MLHTINIFPQNRKDELEAYKHLQGIDMQIHTIPKPPHHKIHDMGLSELHEKEIKLFSMEYNTDHNNNTPNNDLEYFVNTHERHEQDHDPGINDIFLNNLPHRKND
jgi:hypothetical protein